MKVLLVNDHLHPVGGAERYTLALAARLQARGHEPSGFCLETPGADEPTDYPVHHAPRPRVDSGHRLRRTWNPAGRRALARAIAAERPDVVHVNGIFSRLSPSALTAAARVPTVMTLHDARFVSTGFASDEETGFDRFVQRFRNHENRRRLGELNRIITPTEFLRDMLREAFDLEATVVPHGVDTEAHAAGPPPGEQRILYVGRFTRDKGVHVLLDAYARVRERRPEVRLTLVGDDSDEDALRKRAAALGLNGLKFAGRLAAEELPAAYAAADVVCYPSLLPENSPLVILEAMAAGRAVVASEVGGIPELVEEGVTGLLVPPGDTEELAASLFAVLDAFAVDYGRAARALALERHTCNRHLDAIERIYTEVAR